MADDLSPGPALRSDESADDERQVAEGNQGARVVGVRFRDSGRIQFLEAGTNVLEVGTWVVCTTSRGSVAGRVVIAPHQVLMFQLDVELKPIDRVLSREDVDRMEELRSDSARIVTRAGEIAHSANFDVKFVGSEYTLDGSTVVISFTTNDLSRIEELREVLNRELGMSVQMRHVGSRDEALLIGGLGTCRPLRSGRSYENDHYRRVKQELPRLGQRIPTPEGEGLVVSLHVFKELVTVRLADPSREQTFSAEALMDV